MGDYDDLPPAASAAVISAAAAAVNRLEDDDPRKVEQVRGAKVLKDRDSGLAAIETLRTLVGRYCQADTDRDRCSAAISAVEEGLLGQPGWLVAELDTWAEPRRRGQPRREDTAAFVAVILGLARSGWPVQRAARAVADLVDQVWSADSRTQAKAYAAALWGAAAQDEDAEGRRYRLTEYLRQQAQTAKKVPA